MTSWGDFTLAFQHQVRRLTLRISSQSSPDLRGYSVSYCGAQGGTSGRWRASLAARGSARRSCGDARRSPHRSVRPTTSNASISAVAAGLVGYSWVRSVQIMVSRGRPSGSGCAAAGSPHDRSPVCAAPPDSGHSQDRSGFPPVRRGRRRTPPW